MGKTVIDLGKITGYCGMNIRLSELSKAYRGPLNRGEPLFATPGCNTSRATWSTPSEPPPKKPFFEVLSFSALFGTGCCCQLVCFEFGVLYFRLPLYTRNGQVGEHVLLWFFMTSVMHTVDGCLYVECVCMCVHVC